MLGAMKLHEKSSVFRRCLKISSEGAERAVDGKLFHARAAATLKALSLTVESRVGGTTTVSVAACHANSEITSNALSVLVEQEAEISLNKLVG